MEISLYHPINACNIRPIYCDMDGVVANFVKEAEAILGADYAAKMNKAHWGTLHAYPDFFKDLEELPDARKLMDFLHPTFNVKMLTAIPFRGIFPMVTDHKRDWIKSRWPEIDVFFGPFAKDKQYHAKPGYILIDDTEINCEQWEARGGIAILHKSAEDTISQLQRVFETEGRDWYELPQVRKEIYQ